MVLPIPADIYPPMCEAQVVTETAPITDKAIIKTGAGFQIITRNISKGPCQTFTTPSVSLYLDKSKTYTPFAETGMCHITTNAKESRECELGPRGQPAPRIVIPPGAYLISNVIWNQKGFIGRYCTVADRAQIGLQRDFKIDARPCGKRSNLIPFTVGPYILHD